MRRFLTLAILSFAVTSPVRSATTYYNPEGMFTIPFDNDDVLTNRFVALRNEYVKEAVGGTFGVHHDEDPALSYLRCTARLKSGSSCHRLDSNPDDGVQETGFNTNRLSLVFRFTTLKGAGSTMATVFARNPAGSGQLLEGRAWIYTFDPPQIRIGISTNQPVWGTNKLLGNAGNIPLNNFSVKMDDWIRLELVQDTETAFTVNLYRHSTGARIGTVTRTLDVEAAPYSAIHLQEGSVGFRTAMSTDADGGSIDVREFAISDYAFPKEPNDSAVVILFR